MRTWGFSSLISTSPSVGQLEDNASTNKSVECFTSSAVGGTQARQGKGQASYFTAPFGLDTFGCAR